MTIKTAEFNVTLTTYFLDFFSKSVIFQKEKKTIFHWSKHIVIS